MSIFEIVLKTIVSTIDFLLTFAVFRTTETDFEMRKAFLVLILINLVGVWI